MTYHGSRVRKRREANPFGTVRLGEWFFQQGSTWKHESFVDVNSTSIQPYQSLQITFDDVHPRSSVSVGGPFLSLKVGMPPLLGLGKTTFDTKFSVTFNFINAFRRYIGTFGAPDFTGFGYTASQLADSSFLLGPQGPIPSIDPWLPLVDRTLRPRLAKAHLAQAAFELRDAPRMLRTTGSAFLNQWKVLTGGRNIGFGMSKKDFADNFLNQQFGWIPFVQDVYDICNVAINAKEFMIELQNMNNQWTKRKGTLFDTTVGDAIINQLGSGIGIRVQPRGNLLDQCVDTGGDGVPYRYFVSEHIRQRVWAEGKAKFYRPEFDTSLLSHDDPTMEVRRYITLLGARVTPALLYKITPWTWLIDWFTTIGSTLDGLEAAALDGVVYKDLYCMHYQERELVLHQSIKFPSGLHNLEFRRRFVSKNRTIPEVPFGFGLSPTMLSGKQWAILGALGLTHFT